MSFPHSHSPSSSFQPYVPYHTNLLSFGRDHAEEPEEGHWLVRPVKDWMAKPIYAISPDQYEELYKIVNEKKEKLYERTRKDWENKVHRPTSIDFPLLPPPRSLQEFPLPQYSDREKRERRLPLFLFNKHFRDAKDYTF